MKKVFTILAAISMMALSCNKETPVSENGSIPASGKLTATIVPTKVAYTETSEMNLQPSWEVGDEIIGFDDNGNTYTLSVASVSAETATLSGTVPDGALHLIYKSGAKASDIANKTLAIDYTSQAGDKTMPAVMLADGTVEDGACDFTFTNAGAIIGISAVKGVPQGTKITKITISGENLSAATIALDGSSLALNVTEKSDDAISVSGLDLTVTDNNGALSAPVFLSVPAGAWILKVSVPVTKAAETMKTPSATPQEGVDYVIIAGIKWAKWNVGANSETDYGWYFPWAGTEGYVRYANSWQLPSTTSFEFSYTRTPAKLAKAGDYIYVKTQAFTVTGHSFYTNTAPYHTDSSDIHTGWTKYISSSQSSYWSGEGSPDNKTILELEDDAARFNWGGNWRMPKSSEFKSLYDSCLGSDGSYNTTKYATTKCGESTKFSRGVYWCGNYDGVAGVVFSSGRVKLFFPGAAQGDKTDKKGTNICQYWSSDLKTDTPNNARYLNFGGAVASPNSHSTLRYLGLTVRPVSD